MQNKEIGGRAVKLELAKKREALKQGERRGGAKRPAPGVAGGPGGPGGARAERVEPAERKRTQPSTDTARAAESTPKAQPANSAAPVNSTDDKAAKKKLAKRNARLARKEGKLRRSKGADAAKAVGTKPVVARCRWLPRALGGSAASAWAGRRAVQGPGCSTRLRGA